MDEAHNLNPRKPANHQATDEHGSRVLSDNYVVVAQLADTAVSSVEIIRELATGRHLLAKTVNSSNNAVQERFHAAILEHGRLQHQNIAQTVDWRLSEDGRPVFISEFLEGVSLAELIDEVGTLEDDDEITTFLFQLCDALEYAHGQNLVHGGLKPSNVIITKPEDVIIVKVLDFGKTNSTRELPEHPEVAGSAYLSPEQRIGETTAKSDVFSLAAVAYQLITGYLPFLKIDDGRVLDEVASELAPVFDYRPDIPEADKLGAVLAQALDWDPKKRTASVQEFRKGINSWYHSIGGTEYETEYEEDGEEEQQSSQPKDSESSPAIAKRAVEVDNIDDADFGDFDAEQQLAQPTSDSTVADIDDADFGELDDENAPEESAHQVVDDADTEDLVNEPVSAIGIIVKAADPVKKKPGDPGYDEFEDIDDLDDLDELDEIDELDDDSSVSDAKPSATPSPQSRTTGFGSDIADEDFAFEDPDETNAAPQSQSAIVEAGSTPTFSPPDPEGDRARKLAGLDAAKSEITIPPDQELSGRFSRVARLPAMQAVPGMEASVVAPPQKPVPVKTEAELEHEKEKETIKKFKKPPKRQKSKLDSTMTKLMALRSNIVEQELTVSTKISETFAKSGPRQSPKMVIIRIVASVIIFLASTVLVIANMNILSSVWTVSSRTLSSMLLKKQPTEDATTISTTKTIIEDASTHQARIAGTNETASAEALKTASSANPNASPAPPGKLQTNIMYVPRVIDSRNIAPRTMPTPGTRRYTGEVYPYLFTEQQVARDPKQPRPTDSPVKEVTGE